MLTPGHQSYLGGGSKRSTPIPGRPLTRQVWGGALEAVSFKSSFLCGQQGIAFRKRCLTRCPSLTLEVSPAKDGDIVCYQLPCPHPVSHSPNSSSLIILRRVFSSEVLECSSSNSTWELRNTSSWDPPQTHQIRNFEVGSSNLFQQACGLS